MSLKALLGLENTGMSDVEIMRKIKEAMDKGEAEVTFTAKDGTVIMIKLPPHDFSKQIDPWDGKPGRANYPQV